MFSLNSSLSPKKDSQKIESPPGSYGFFALRHLYRMRRDIIGFFQDMKKKHGDVVLFGIRKTRIFMIQSPEDIRHVLQENSANYHKSVFYDELKRILGKGLLTSEGDFWKKQRRLIQPAFHRQRISEFTHIMAEETRTIFQEWESRQKNGTLGVDLSEEMMRLTFAIVGKTLFRSDVKEYSDIIATNVEIAMQEVTKRLTMVFPPPIHWPLPGNRRLRNAIESMNEVIYELIDQRRKNPSNDLISMLLEIQDEETGEKMSVEQVRDEAITLLLAGHETTANALTWAFYLLSNHPDVFSKLKAEAKNVLGEKIPSLEDVGSLTYSRMVLEESMRLFPPAWTVERSALGWDEVGGYKVPPGTNVSICIYTIHRDPRFWKEPEKFWPERFSEENSKDRPKYAYIPFGGGPRICIGNVFAMTEGILILSMIARKYDLRPVPGHKVELEPLVTLRPKHGMWMDLVST
ncbi:cytochrome P450 [Leptospira sp. 201903070]|uniref:Cytochrome P450 n=1 Tax=Leptospira ainlahdjerensis TaxID=2810033 RepID=A0ABS2UC22_9LEPT|nr:cytochrome P450 [Leptospira ainlahdjerensis]MBM9577498.1 cytochrome P450 [Leptospira ainlahdjerensis]